VNYIQLGMKTICPYCGRDFISEGEFSNEPKFGDFGFDVSFEIKCKCGHVFEKVYVRAGIFDSESGEYISD